MSQADSEHGLVVESAGHSSPVCAERARLAYLSFHAVPWPRCSAISVGPI